ncbi:MAG: hypothetical protein HC899_26150 [Leptolyngbyaceae cyanobacterium SM1_4_3]|nr:hypothetical protein [Leptolyngbyaceae cyanobacterium SM1_4_3]NJN89231.1 hypothetical protein [Leptolyngbyaceae cyanobacterium SL_5_14]
MRDELQFGLETALAIQLCPNYLFNCYGGGRASKQHFPANPGNELP